MCKVETKPRQGTTSWTSPRFSASKSSNACLFDSQHAIAPYKADMFIYLTPERRPPKIFPPELVIHPGWSRRSVGSSTSSGYASRSPLHLDAERVMVKAECCILGDALPLTMTAQTSSSARRSTKGSEIREPLTSGALSWTIASTLCAGRHACRRSGLTL